MIAAPSVLELLEFHKALAPFRERLRGELGVRALWKPLAPAYDFYSFKIIPKLGRLVTQDETNNKLSLKISTVK